jgi:paraquat-inducible protein A
MDHNSSETQHNLYRSLAFTLTAIALYIPANLYPFMTMKYTGLYKETTIMDGINSLYESGMWITATIVFMASIIIPVFKLLSMLFIIISKIFKVSALERNSLLLLVDFIGRWAMLDVFLVAIMVALVKFGSFATVWADVASYLLGGVVIFTMLASATLTTHVKSLKQREIDG